MRTTAAPRHGVSAARRITRAMTVAVAASALLTATAHGDSGRPTRGAESRADTKAATGASRLPEPVQRLDITGTEYSFEISPDPATGLRAGWTEVHFTNVGGEAHQVMFAAPKEGVDLGALAQAGAGDSSGASAIEFVDMLGGVSYIGPGRETTAMVDLPEGVVLAMCFVPDPQGTAHALRGMSSVLILSTVDAAPTATASGAPGRNPGSKKAKAPKLRGTIELAADGYRIPKTLPTGWYRVRNTDTGDPATGLHELSVLRLARAVRAPGIRDLVDDLANATPDVELEALGGMGAISPGFEGYLYLDLPSGNYLAVDFMPDPGVPTPHMVDGYYATFRP